MGKIDQFQSILEDKPIGLLSPFLIKRILIFYGWLSTRIDSLVSDGRWTETQIKSHKDSETAYIPKKKDDKKPELPKE